MQSTPFDLSGKVAVGAKLNFAQQEVADGVHAKDIAEHQRIHDIAL